MDELDDPTTPPPLGADPLAAPDAATPDAFSSMLNRHRRRQFQIVGPVLAAVLVVGGLAGFAVGHDNASSGTTRVAAANAPATPTPSPSGAGAAPSVAGGPITASGGVASAVAPMSPEPSTQLLVRNATDGVRVRLYSQAMAVPQVKCATSDGAPCPQPLVNCTATKGAACPAIAPAPACFPQSSLTAEVSDDQVAGEIGGLVFQTPSGAGFTPVTAGVVGQGQPQPILVVAGWAGTGVTGVTLTTSYGTDTAVPGKNGWVALAVQLPADFTSSKTEPGFGLPDGTVSAAGPSGSTTALSAISPKPGVLCEGGAVGSPGSGVSGSSGGASSGSGTSGSASVPPATLVTPPGQPTPETAIAPNASTQP